MHGAYVFGGALILSLSNLSPKFDEAFKVLGKEIYVAAEWG
jgi:hypothetical protein